MSVLCNILSAVEASNALLADQCDKIETQTTAITQMATQIGEQTTAINNQTALLEQLIVLNTAQAAQDLLSFDKLCAIADALEGDCAGVVGCIQMEAWDNDSGLFSPGEFSQLEIKVDNVSVAGPIVHDYSLSQTGTSKASWYDPWVAAINANTNFTLSLVTDVVLPSNGKPLWQVDYSGPGGEELRLCKGTAGTTSPEELVITAAADGTLTGNALDYGGVAPIPSPVFSAC